MSLTGEPNRVEFLELVEKGLRDSLREKERGEKRKSERLVRLGYRIDGWGWGFFVLFFSS